MITAAIVNDTRHIQLSVTSNGTPLTVERDGQQVDVTGIRFTYKEGAVTAIRIITTDGHLFAAEEDLDDPDSWVAWIRALADAHQPLPNRLELEALDSVMQGDTYSANGFILGIDAQQRRELANHLDIYRTLLDRALQAETAA